LTAVGANAKYLKSSHQKTIVLKTTEALAKQKIAIFGVLPKELFYRFS
jgi:hypothetical protein